MRPTWRAIVCAAAVGLAATAARAELFSKAYAFKANTVLQVGAEIGAGLRLDSIEWIVTQDDGSPSGLFSGPHVKVAISNVGSASAKVAIAAAVTDGEGRLVAVASGGTKLFPLRAGRQMVYAIDVDGVSAELAQGTVFRISVETKP